MGDEISLILLCDRRDKKNSEMKKVIDNADILY